MNEQEEQVQQWVIEACRHPPGSPTRQRYLTKVIRYTTRKLWKETTAYYQDALQQTWVYFCQNVCERGTGDRYDPTRSTVATWLNSYLKRRLQDFYIDTQKQQVTRAKAQRQLSRSGDEDVIDPVDKLAAEPDIPPILDEVRVWAEADATGDLRSTHIEGHPAVNCQTLILRRLPPETSWKDLSAEFGLSVSTLSSFYQRQCLTRLRKFGESEGYL
ncbi:MAG TPA: sigma-70 family RNA polymerase sigma factor [Crinalium sp.]|jgi:hypothetical protein